MCIGVLVMDINLWKPQLAEILGGGEGKCENIIPGFIF